MDDHQGFKWLSLKWTVGPTNTRAEPALRTWAQRYVVLGVGDFLDTPDFHRGNGEHAAATATR